MLLIAAAYLSFTKVPKISEPLPAREQRIVLDASCLMVAMLLGYRLFLNFANTEGIVVSPSAFAAALTPLNLLCSLVNSFSSFRSSRLIAASRSTISCSKQISRSVR